VRLYVEQSCKCAVDVRVGDILLLCVSTVSDRIDKWMPYPKESYGVIAPEALIGLQVTPLSDIYGLAVTLWEVLHGKSHCLYFLFHSRHLVMVTGWILNLGPCLSLHDGLQQLPTVQA